MNPLSTKILIFLTFHKLMKHFNKSYCWPTRKTIQTYLKDWYGRDVSISYIDDCISYLNTAGYIKSYRNYGRRNDGTIHLKPSNRQITRKGALMLMKLGITVARAVWAALKMGFKSGKTRAPLEGPYWNIKKLPAPDPNKNPFKDPQARKRAGLKNI